VSAPDATRPVGAGSVLSGRYRLIRLIAQGGMAAVWEAHDNVLARAVAVKMLHPHLAADRLFLERFRREAVSAARLAHPNVVATFDAGVTPEGVAYIVMELVRGQTLSAFQAAHHPVPGTACIEIGTQIADALAHAHAAGLVHRDVKPANVLVCDTGRDGTLLVKVTDFGIAKAAEGLGLELTKTGVILGTPRYLSPEQIEGREPDARADIYALGVVMFELVAGVPPFQGPTEMAVAMQHLNQPAPRLRDIRPNVPPALDALVAQMLAKRPDQRPSSALAVRRALAAVAAQLRTNRPPASPGPVPTPTTAFAPRPSQSQPPGARPTPPRPSSSRPAGPPPFAVGAPPGTPESTWRPAPARPSGQPSLPGQPIGPVAHGRAPVNGPPMNGPAVSSGRVSGNGPPVSSGRLSDNGSPMVSDPRTANSRPSPPRSRLAEGLPGVAVVPRPAGSAPPGTAYRQAPRQGPATPRRPNWAGRVVAALVVAALVVVIVVVGDHGSGTAHSPGTGTTVAPASLAIHSVSVFHLERDADHAADVGLTIDGNPNTAWETDRYDNATFAGLRRGLGLAFTLGSVHTLHVLKVTSSTLGWSAQVFVADGVPNPPTLAAWGAPVAVHDDIQGDWTFSLGGHQGSAILLWITYLGPTFQASIAEVSVS
jgi:serine/threonine-protein kinase